MPAITDTPTEIITRYSGTSHIPAGVDPVERDPWRAFRWAAVAGMVIVDAGLLALAVRAVIFLIAAG